jgi:hypothetical protein
MTYDENIWSYLFVRTAAFVALTSASTLWLALPHLLGL